MSWYRTGTVAVTNGSKTVTGVGTLFTTAVNVGDAFALVDANLNPTGAWYEVDVVVSNTEITLKQSYAGTTGSNNQYCVFNMVGNMTTPSFAQRLATFFASFQSLIDKPTVTPTAASIPIADSGGKIADGWIPAKYFNKTNILGTVSQTGGVPTGAVIERGSNANGSYVKFADGTLLMLCTMTALETNNGSNGTGFTLPIEVASRYDCVAATSVTFTSGGLAARVIEIRKSATTSFEAKVMTIMAAGTLSASSDTPLEIFVYGRWF